MLEAAAVVALDHGVAAELDDQPVADLAQHVGAFTPLAPFLPALDAAAFLTPQRLHLDRSLQLLGLGVGRRRRAGRLLGLRLSRLALGRGVFRFLGAVEDRRVAAGAGGIVVARPGIVAWATAVVVIRPRRGGVGRPFAGRRRGLVLIRRPLAIAIAVATVAARLGLRVIIGGRPRTVARRALAGRRRSLVLSGRSVAVATIAARLGLALIGRRCGALLVVTTFAAVAALLGLVGGGRRPVRALGGRTFPGRRRGLAIGCVIVGRRRGALPVVPARGGRRFLLGG
ncbi:MAG TPA: hypothetical protein PL183_07015, partial [Aquamicrobium sp.]|nr:hypothetical protein [Aquamicrobium sp.]